MGRLAILLFMGFIALNIYMIYKIYGHPVAPGNPFTGIGYLSWIILDAAYIFITLILLLIASLF